MATYYVTLQLMVIVTDVRNENNEVEKFTENLHELIEIKSTDNQVVINETQYLRIE